MPVPHSGKGWRLAPALIAMEAEADRIAPRRRRTSDGSIGDQAHAARKSHHNPDGGYVDALDISHDPANGMDVHAHARAMIARQDPRLEEVISNRQIWTWARRAEGWRRYTGANGHTIHAHFVVKNSHRNDTSPWFKSGLPFPTKPVPPPYTPPPAPTEDTDVTAYIRLNKPGHALHGRIEAVGDFHRRHIATKGELDLLTFLGAKIQNVDPAGWNNLTANKAVVDSKGARA